MAAGYYRVNYDVSDWNKIIGALKDDLNQITTSNRGQLLDDVFTLARIGKVGYNIALELSSYLSGELEYIPWENALRSMSYFGVVLTRSKVYGLYSDFLLELTNNLYSVLGWNEEPNESILQQYQRINAIGSQCFYGNEDCIQNVQSRFNEWMNTGVNNISPNLRSLVYCNAVRYGSYLEWDFIFDKYQNEQDSNEKSKLSSGLVCSKESWINTRFLTYITDDSYIRKQDASSLIESLSQNDNARDLVWSFLKENWDFIYDNYGSGSFSFSGIIEAATSHFSTEYELKELEDFISENQAKLGSGQRAIEQSLEQTRTNINWRNLYEADVYDWLLKR